VTSDPRSLERELRARPDDGVVNLAGYSTVDTPGVSDEDDANDELETSFRPRLYDLHDRLMAEEQRSVLLVLQGLDASGKGGTIKHVVIAMNPSGVSTASFVAPTEEEAEQHFLERIRVRVPEPGQLGVFDRSHYEDVVVPLARRNEDESVIDQRIDEINEFESELTDGGTTIVKCLLHVSFEEQRERFLRRLRRDDKRWKFSEEDLDTRTHWDEFQAAYGNVLARTSPEHAPWYVIPADHKWYRNWAVGSLLVHTLESLALAYPQPRFDIESLRARLEPPN
jgi:PPK2 family polyphosphate:nucleotide phosphotransferase